MFAVYGDMDAFTPAGSESYIRGTKTLSPSFYCFYNTLHTSLLACPFFLSAVFFLENVFHQVTAHFCLWNDGLEIS